jgi:hypothetical protein
MGRAARMGLHKVRYGEGFGPRKACKETPFFRVKTLKFWTKCRNLPARPDRQSSAYLPLL